MQRTGALLAKTLSIFFCNVSRFDWFKMKNEQPIIMVMIYQRENKHLGINARMVSYNEPRVLETHYQCSVGEHFLKILVRLVIVKGKNWSFSS